MKIVIYGDQARIGALEGEDVVDLRAAYEGSLRKAGRNNPEGESLALFGTGLADLIASGSSGLDAAEEAIAYALGSGSDEGVTLRRSEVRLRAPWPRRRIACAGGNYADHLAGMQGGSTLEEITAGARETGQWGFWKVPADVAGPDDDVPYPKRTEYLDYEAEVAIIIGGSAKDIRAGDIDRLVWGVTLLDDISIRDGMGRPFAMSYNRAKNFDGATAMGPAIVVREGLDPMAVDVELKINGESRQHYNSSAMIFSFGEIIEYLSEDFTFVPGDVISGGTAKGTAADKTPRPGEGQARAKDLFLKPNDEIEISSPQIGTFKNRVVATS